MSDTINLQYTIIRHPLPDFIYDNLKTFSADANAYQSQPNALKEKLAIKHHINQENIFLTAGIDEAIQLFGMAYGTHTAIFTPTYTVYEEIPNFGNNKLETIHALNNTTYQINPQHYPDATLICVVNPNNPCGQTSVETIKQLVTNNPQAIVTVDEAYAEFVDFTMLHEVQNYPNLAVLRSLSKAYGMAGNRVGYVVAQPPVIEKIKSKTQWCNVSYLSVGAAITALDHEEYFEKIRQAIIIERKKLEETLTNSKLTLIPSLINACLIKFATESAAQHFVDYLAINNITISHGNGNSNTGLDTTFVRIAIGTPEQMSIARKIVEKYTNV